MTKYLLGSVADEICTETIHLPNPDIRYKTKIPKKENINRKEYAIYSEKYKNWFCLDSPMCLFYNNQWHILDDSWGLLDGEVVKINLFEHSFNLIGDSLILSKDPLPTHTNCIHGLIWTLPNFNKVKSKLEQDNEIYYYASSFTQNLLSTGNLQTTHKANKNNPLYKAVLDKYTNTPLTIQKGVNLESLLPIIQNKSFGFEFEVSKGRIPYNKYHYGIIHVMDGSLPSSGIEYCTLPFKDIEGLHRLYNITTELSKYCGVNSQCSLHLNIGNIKPSKDFLVAFYMLYTRVQEEILNIFPAYSKDPVSIAGKRKQYAGSLMPLPNPSKKDLQGEEEFFKWIDNTYEIIEKIYLSDDKNKERQLQEENPWVLAGRYSQVNLVPYFTGSESSRRIEFRVHPPTTNTYKTFIWLCICMSLLNYAEKNTMYILQSYSSKQKILLVDVLYSIRCGYQHTDEAALSTNLVNISDFLMQYVEEQHTLRIIQHVAAHHQANSTQAGLQGKNKLLMDIAQEEFNLDPNWIPEFGKFLEY